MTNEEREITKDVLWGMYQEHVIQGRHHEVQRATVTNLIILLAAGITTFVTVDKAIVDADLPATILLMALGLFGAVFSAQHYERYSKHMDRAKQYRDALDCVLPNINDALFANQKKICEDLRRKSSRPGLPILSGLLLALKEAGDDRHKQRKRSRIGSITPGGLHVLWVLLHLLIFSLGLALTVIASKYPHSWQ
jgi:hypothetical protein